MNRLGRYLLVINTVLAWLIAVFVLAKFEYISEFGAIDNLLGMIPVALAIVFASGITYLLWAKNKRQQVPVLITISLFILSSVLLFPTALHGNWWVGAGEAAQEKSAPDLGVFEPFSPDSQTAKLEGKADLHLTGALPVLDGATALYPVYAAFAEAVYDEDSFFPEMVLCSNTRGAYEAIIQGERDIIFVAGASDEQKKAAEDAGVDLVFTPIGREAFVFLVGAENPVDDISDQEIRNVYSGKTAYWRTLGWAEGGRIVAFQRPEGSGSQTGLQRIMGSIPIQSPQPVPDGSFVATSSLMKQLSTHWQGVQPALGYSYRYYATRMYANPDTKMLAVNGIYPSMENIQNESYPFVSEFYAVTKGQPAGNVKLLIDWIKSSQGQELIRKTGYSPIL